MGALVVIIVVDTREQAPYRFGRWDDAYVVFDTLPFGDYTVWLGKRRAAIERKSASDFYKSIGKDHDRFFRELEQLACIQYPVLLIENDLPSAVEPEKSRASKLKPEHVWGALQAITLNLRIPVIFGSCRNTSEIAAYKMLTHMDRLLMRPSEYAIPFDGSLTCSTCGKTRMQAMKERPDLGADKWTRLAVRTDSQSRVVLGDKIAVCYECRRAIANKAAVLPDGYGWEKK